MATVLWDDDDGLVVEPADRMDTTMRAVTLLRASETLGQLRSADLPDWARQVVEVFEERMADEGHIVGDPMPWDWDVVSDLVIEWVPLPWDAASVADWLGWDVLAAHAEISGASPGGNIDGYDVTERDAFFAELERLGYTLDRRPGLLKHYYDAL